MAEYLEAVRVGQIKRLIINIAPRSLKSICASIALPAYALGKNPSEQIIGASYAKGLSRKLNVDTRLVVESDWYKAIFPMTRIADDQNEKAEFMTTAKGFRLATSVGGGVIGKGFDLGICLPAGEMIMTKQGEIDIQKIVEGTMEVEVASYNHEREEVEFKLIEDYQINDPSEIYEIETDDGVFRCTGDHPVYVKGKGYIAAKELQEDDVLIKLD